AGGPSLAEVDVAFRMLPPELATSVLNQTTTPSYWAPWISIRCGLPCLARAWASANIWAQVVGGVFTRSDRYHGRRVPVGPGEGAADHLGPDVRRRPGP